MIDAFAITFSDRWPDAETYWPNAGNTVRETGPRPVELRLRVRRFSCDNRACPTRAFAERPDGLSVPRPRQTSLLRPMLTAIAVALAT